MAEHTCPNCGKAFQIGDEVCRFCGFVFPFSTVVIPVGRLLHSRYEIQEMIHTGGMGYIYLAKDKVLFDRLCIVKQVRESIQSEAHQKKLEAEALSMAKLTHPNIAMILDHFVEGGYYFLVVERISGKTLSEVIKDRRGHFTEREVLDWAITICDVVTYLHNKGVIHRDISPDNIMLTEEGTIKFIDFGTSHEFRFFGSAGTVGIGKYGYTPPEQWRGKPEQRSDIFALGATVYYLLTDYLPLSQEFIKGQSPQKEDYNPLFPPVRTKNPNVSPKLEAVLQKALQLDIDKRYTTAAEFCQALKGVETRGKKSVVLKPKVKKVHAPKTARSFKWKPVLIWGMAGVLLALIVIGVALKFSVFSNGDDQENLVDAAIEGYVRDTATNDPITGATVNVLEVFTSSANDTSYTPIAVGYSDSSGYYRTAAFSGNGTYVLQVSAGSYVTQWSNNTTDIKQAELLTFKPGETLNINFLLVKSGSISGKISSTIDTDFIHGVLVTVLDSATGTVIIKTANVLPNSDYIITDLPPGDYYVKSTVTWSNYDIYYYNNSPSISGATLVTVTSGQDIPNIDFDFSLMPGSISGKISGQPPDYYIGRLYIISIVVLNPTTEKVIATKVINNYDNYTITGLPPGDYYIRVSTPSSDYPLYYKNSPSISTATLVTVTAGKNTPNIDFDFSLTSTTAPPPESPNLFQGYVRDASTFSPIPDAAVVIYELYTNSANYSFYTYKTTAYTDSSGYYQTEALSDTGPYILQANALNYVIIWYKDVIEKDDATPITFNTGETLNVNFTVYKSGSISGKVNTESVYGLFVEVIEPSTGKVVATTTSFSGADKYYKFTGLMPGDYYVRAYQGSVSWAIYYKNSTSMPGATLVKVTAEQETQNINIDLINRSGLTRAGVATRGQPSFEKYVSGSTIQIKANNHTYWLNSVILPTNLPEDRRIW